MEAQRRAEQVTREETRGSAGLWFGVLGSPAAWGGHLAVNYALEEWFACSPSAGVPGQVLGLTVDTFSVAFNSAMLALALASGVVAFLCHRRIEAGGDERSERARWMAFAGIVEGVLFTAVILVGYVPPLLLGTCEVAP